MLGSKLVSTPSDPSNKLCNDISDPCVLPSYRRLIDKLIYLNTIRLDITYITQQLSQFLSKPSIIPYNVACRVLRHHKCYLSNKDLFFYRDSSIHLLEFSDIDWAGCINTRRSISCSCSFSGTIHFKKINFILLLLRWNIIMSVTLMSHFVPK